MYARIAHHYHMTFEQIDELTYDQIRLYHHLAVKNRTEELRAQAALIAQRLVPYDG